MTTIEQPPRHAIITPISGATIYISDFQKTAYDEIIYTWSPIQSTKIDPISFESTPGQCSFTVANNVAINGVSRFSKLQGLIFADIKIYQSDVLIFWGTIEDLTNIGNADVTVQCIGKDAELSKLFRHTIIEKTTFPYADPDDMGKMLPVVYGEAKRVPFLGIDVGASTRLAVAMDKTDTEFTVADASLFGASGSVDIDNERISYSAIADNVFTVTSRGVDSDVSEHPVMSIVREVKAAHIYGVDGPVSAIGDIYIGDKKIGDIPPYGVTIQTWSKGDHPDYPGVACIGITYAAGKNITSFGGGGGVTTLSITNGSILALEQGKLDPVRPISSTPATSIGQAYNNDLTDCFNSTSSGNPISGEGNGYDPVKKYVAFKFPNTEVMPSYIGKTVHILIDTSFCANPDNAVVINFSPNAGMDTLSDEFQAQALDVIIDPTVGVGGCPTWFAIPDTEDPGVSAWCTILWKNEADSEIKIYDIHMVYSYAPPMEEEDECYPSCPNCQHVTLPVAPLNNIPPESPSSTPSTTGTAFTFDRVYADVSGIGDGGSPAVVFGSPEDIITDIISDRCGLTITKNYDTTGYIENVVILQPPDVRALLSRIASQAKCISFFTPGAHYLKQMTGAYSTGAVISADDIFQNQSWCNWTNKGYIINRIDSLYNYFWWGKDNGIFSVSGEDSDSPTSQSEYGIISVSKNFAYIANGIQAQAVLDWMLDWLKRPRLIVEFIGTLTNNIDRKIGDVITYDTTDEYLDAMLAELVGPTDQFLILDKVLQPDGAIRFETIGL